MFDVHLRDVALKTENLKLKEEICMLKTENLKLVNDLKSACVSDVEKKRVWEQEAIKTRIALEAEQYAKSFVHQRRGLGYNHASKSQGVSNNVPIVAPQVSTCNR